MEDSGTETAARLEEIHGLFQDAVADNPSLSLLRGFKVDFSGNQDFHKIYLAARCACGTAALLSVEVGYGQDLARSPGSYAQPHGKPGNEGQAIL